MKGKKSILLIEDDRIDAMTVKRALNELKVTNKLEHAVNGVEGMSYLQDHRHNTPCIILLDLNMPKMNGLEFLNEVKKDKLFRKIPIVVLTTSSAEPDVHQSFSIGVAGYMVKPVNYRDFIEVMKEIKMYWTISELPN